MTTLVDVACFYCGCTEQHACMLYDRSRPFDGPIPCHWHREPDHRGFAVCSNPECVKAYIADLGAP